MFIAAPHSVAMSNILVKMFYFLVFLQNAHLDIVKDHHDMCHCAPIGVLEVKIAPLGKN